MVSCPFDLAVTGPASEAAVSRALGLGPNILLSCKQWICVYLVLHWIVGEDSEASQYLKHFSYLELLPPQRELLTALYFTEEELDAFKGTNLYGARNDRFHDWRKEWTQCREIVSKSKPEWGTQFEWNLYLAAATYISSRAFPSTVLSDTPQLPRLDDETPSDPILLPGVDIANHARGQPVSWITHTGPDTTVPRVAIVPHRPTLAGQEIFNNYGPKPNAELILGYGFTLPNNPDDTIILKVGGINGKKWSIGRNAAGVDGLWNEILRAVRGGDESEDEADYETILDASEALQEMVSTLLERLPDPNNLSGKDNIRPYVAQMFGDYVEGQHAVLTSLLEYSQQKEREAIDLARSQGIELVMEEEDDS